MAASMLNRHLHCFGNFDLDYLKCENFVSLRELDILYKGNHYYQTSFVELALYRSTLMVLKPIPWETTCLVLWAPFLLPLETYQFP